MAKLQISKRQFEDYVRVQKSGVTNMFAVDVVQKLSGLTRDHIMAIMDQYGDLANKHPEVVA